MCKEIDTFLNRSSPSQPQIHEKNFTKMYLKSYHSARRNMNQEDERSKALRGKQRNWNARKERQKAEQNRKFKRLIDRDDLQNIYHFYGMKKSVGLTLENLDLCHLYIKFNSFKIQTMILPLNLDRVGKLSKQNNRRKNINLLICILIFVALSSSEFNMTYSQFINSTPTVFGLLTVTHQRGSRYKQISNHLKRYAEMQCNIMADIIIVWNNQQSVKQSGVLNNQHLWKRPVYFVKTESNSMDFRYTFAEESTTKIFFSIDDDIHISCSQLTKSFQFWRSKAVGDIGPLISYMKRSFNTELISSNIIYTYKQPYQFYSLMLTGIAWIPRHYLELYNSNTSFIGKMRNIVQQENNCDDLAMNFLVNQVYPEFTSIHFMGDYSMEIPKVAQSKKNNHLQVRGKCLTEFTKILGACPLKLIKFDISKFDENLFIYPFSKRQIYQKRKNLEIALTQQAKKLEPDFIFSQQLQQQFDEDVAKWKLPKVNPFKAYVKAVMFVCGMLLLYITVVTIVVFQYRSRYQAVSLSDENQKSRANF